jgi:hypothetical protein
LPHDRWGYAHAPTIGSIRCGLEVGR